MLVLAQVSSRKTKRSGSRSSWPSNQSSRRFRISGRSCSVACAVFFARDAVTAEVAPERCHAGERPLTRQALLQLGQCHVRHRGERGRDQAGMGLRAIREPITTLWLGPSIATSPTQSLPADRARGADTEPRRRLATGQTLVNGAQNTRPEIEMQRSRHEGRPPLPANTLNQIATFSATPPTQSARKTL